MILAVLLIFIGIHNQIYNSDHNLRLQQRTSSPLLSNHHQSLEEESFTLYGSVHDNLYAINTHYISTPTPKFFYLEYLPNDPYELYMQARERDPNKCKKAACGTICCSIFSVIGCLLFHCI